MKEERKEVEERYTVNMKVWKLIRFKQMSSV